MKIIISLLTIFILTGLTIPAIADTIEPPLKQYDSKTDPHNIKCKPNLQLVFKDRVWSPACVKPLSVDKLIERGWAAKDDPHHMDIMMPSIEDRTVFFTLQGDNHIASLGKEKWIAGPKMTYLSTNNDGTMILATSSDSDTVFAFDTSQEKPIYQIQVGSTPFWIAIPGNY